MKSLIFLLLFFFPFISIYSQDTLNVPADYTTIQAAIDAANNGDVVLVAEDTYYENIDFSGKAITVASHFILDDDTLHIQNTIIDGSQPADSNLASVVRFASGEDTTSVLYGFTITGGLGTIWYSGPYSFRVGGGIYIDNASPIIRNNIIELNELVSDDQGVWGSAMFVIPATHKSMIIENNIVRNNSAQSTYGLSVVGGPIFILALNTNSGSLKIRNNIISDNVNQGDTLGPRGGAIYVRGPNNPDFRLYIENNKILRNEVSATMPTPPGLRAMGGGIWMADVEAEVSNNIIAYNIAERGGGIFYDNFVTSPQCTTEVVNNTIYGNTGTISEGALTTFRYYEVINCIIWGNSSPNFSSSHVANITYSAVEEPYSNGSNNISLNPEFTDTLNFYLNDFSPCIDSGNPGFDYYDIEDPNNPGYALWPAMGTRRNDIGVYGGPNADIVVGVDDEELDDFEMPIEFKLTQNYPNPFNPTTKIRFSIPEAGITTLKVYDILGREIATLLNENKPAGIYEVEFDAVSLASGIYFYQLRAGDFIETKKMILLK